jgi:hypothetical protein
VKDLVWFFFNLVILYEQVHILRNCVVVVGRVGRLPPLFFYKQANGTYEHQYQTDPDYDSE